MKNIKKKLIALLSAACLTAGAFGIAACKKDKPTEEPGASLQDVYSAYVQNVGEEALSYADWLELIKKDIAPNLSQKTISSAAIAEGKMSLTYKDGTAKTLGTVAGSFDIDVIGSTVTINAPAASAAKSAISGAAENEELTGEYAKYLENVGSGALNYEGWVALISSDFALNTDDSKEIKSAEINGRAQLILTYKDNTSLIAGTVSGDFTFNVNGTVQTVEVPVFTLAAVDQHGDPVKNAWVKLAYYDSKTYVTETVESAKTNDEGKAYFACIPEAGVNYKASLADVINTVPAGYTLNLGTEYGIARTSVDFDADRQATLTFRYAPDDFISAQKTTLNYKRVYNSSSRKTEETNAPTEATVNAGRYGYFVFAPYTFSSDNDEKAVTAASGRYRIYVSASDGANAVMYNYAGTVSFMTCDTETGIPTAVVHATGNAPQTAEDKSVYTGTNYIEINLHSGIARAENVFGVTADKSCTVKITVERISDATEPPVPDVVNVAVTGSPEKCAEQNGTLTLVEVDGSVNVVLGNDGYYHIGSKNGPVLYVNLAKTLKRVAEAAIKDLPKQMINGQEIGESVFIFTAEYDANGFATLIKNYNTVVSTYGALCNSDGVYAVNQDLYDFLHFYGNKCFGIGDLSDKSLAWLLPCQYYAL